MLARCESKSICSQKFPVVATLLQSDEEGGGGHDEKLTGWKKDRKNKSLSVQYAMVRGITF